MPVIIIYLKQLSGGMGIGGTVSSIAAAQLPSLGFDPELGLLTVWVFTCPPCVCVDFLWVVWFPSTVQKY